MTAADLPHLNAALNTVAACLLVWGYVLIRRKKEVAHRRVMLTCFAVSIAFLTSYVVYHWQAGSRRFPAAAPPALRWTYLTILASHVVLAATVPFLALATIILGLCNRRVAHRRLARWTFPIWLYVSITGVMVYVMLYWY